MSASFWLGYVAAFGVFAAYQDWLGRDRYIAAVANGWVNTKWWMGGIVFVFCASLHLWNKGRAR